MCITKYQQQQQNNQIVKSKHITPFQHYTLQLLRILKWHS